MIFIYSYLFPEANKQFFGFPSKELEVGEQKSTRDIFLNWTLWHTFKNL